MFCLAKENEENGEQEADNEVDEEEEEGGEEEDEEEEGNGNFSLFPQSPTQSCCVLSWTAGCQEAEDGEQHLPLAAAVGQLLPAGLSPSSLAQATSAGSEVSLESLPAG